MLSEIKGVGKVTEKKLNELNIYTKKDVIERLPRTYVDLTSVTPLSVAMEGQFCIFDAILVKGISSFSKGNLQISKGTVKSGNDLINLVWFNQNYVSKILQKDKEYTFYGKLKIVKNAYEIVNPIFEEKLKKSYLIGVHPIYWTKGYIPQKTYHNIVKEALNTFQFDSIIDESVEKKYKLKNLKESYENLHVPRSTDLKSYKDRVVIENIVRRICAYKVARDTKSNIKPNIYSILKDDYKFENLLPFKLSNSQNDVIRELKNILCSSKSLNGILCGDVGSGKTAVALSIAYFVIKNGYKVALMAPTEILAQQHYNFAKNLFFQLGIKVCFLSGSTKKSEKENIYLSIKNQEFDLIIGTHSLINDELDIPNLGLVIEDEQHRFGVAQRTKLIAKNSNVDVLTLSATPIPRSMQLLAYGEVDYFTIKSRRESAIKTAIVGSQKREAMWRFFRAEANKDNRIFVVAPKIFDAEGIEKESVESLYTEALAYFDEKTVGYLHGKMKPEQKQKAIDDFKKGITKLLISTTVIEVGIDVPEAGIIVIMGAENFGLATLHQLRGRVGRGGQEAYCFLYTEKKPTDGLLHLCSCYDGFELAEKDFELRGAGELFGVEQSGKGTLEGLTYKSLCIAKEIADTVDLTKHSQKLHLEISNYSLFDVSLT